MNDRKLFLALDVALGAIWMAPICAWDIAPPLQIRVWGYPNNVGIEQSKAGRRNYAIPLLLARLGLLAGIALAGGPKARLNGCAELSWTRNG